MPNCFHYIPGEWNTLDNRQEALRQDTLFPSLRVLRSENFAQNVDDRGNKVGSAAVCLGKQHTAEAAHHSRITRACPAGSTSRLPRIRDGLVVWTGGGVSP